MRLTARERAGLTTVLRLTAQLHNVRTAVWHLRVARTHLTTSDAPKSAARVRSAMKSAEGAVRNAERRLSVAQAAMPQLTLDGGRS